MAQTSVLADRAKAFAGKIAEEMQGRHLRTGIVASGKTVTAGQPVIITGQGPHGEDIVRALENADTVTQLNTGGFVVCDTFRDNAGLTTYAAGETVTLMREGVMYLAVTADVTAKNPVWVGNATAQLGDIDDATGVGLVEYPGAQFMEGGSSGDLVKALIRVDV